jgi:hypothetical protein
MKRLMASDVAYGLVLLVFVAAIVAYVYWPHPPRTVVRERTGPTMVLVAPALTPLQARRARRTSAARSPDSARGSATVPQRSDATAPRRQQTATTPQKRAAAKRPKRPTTSPSGSAPSSQQQQPSQPPQSTNPPPSVSVPLPSVCVPPIQVGACP